VNDDIVRAAGLTEAEIVSLTREQLQEIERRRAQYVPGGAPISARGRTAILVDDGVATGASMEAAIKAIRRRAPLRVVVAVPVASRAAVTALHEQVDEVVCLGTPENFGGVGAFYRDFHQLSDSEVVDLLAKHASTAAVSPGDATGGPAEK
jgi:predicted phosphoribosyltransferase